MMGFVLTERQICHIDFKQETKEKWHFLARIVISITGTYP